MTTVLERLVIWHCKKHGHKQKKTRTTYVMPPKSRLFREVADKVVIEESTCRCGLSQSTVEISREGLDGLSMPSSKWEIMRETGRVAI